MKFTKEKIDDLERPGKAKIVRSYVGGGFDIAANIEGVVLSGISPALDSYGELNDFAKALSDAYKDHLTLKPKIVTNISGH